MSKFSVTEHLHKPLVNEKKEKRHYAHLHGGMNFIIYGVHMLTYASVNGHGMNDFCHASFYRCMTLPIVVFNVLCM